MNIQDLLKVREELNGTIATFPKHRTVTVTPSFRKSLHNGVKRYDFGCFDQETIDKLLNDPLSIIYDSGDFS